MGLYDRDYTQFDQRLPQPGSNIASKPAWLTLLVITVVVYFVDMIFFGRDHQLMEFMRVDASTLYRPWMWWQWLTYAFAHSPDIFHVFFNMLGLFFFGSSVEQRIGRNEFFRFYLVAAVLGGIVHSLVLLAQGWTPAAVNQLIAEAGPDYQDYLPSVVGASGSVMAIVILFCFLYPQANILLMMVFPIKAWVAGILFAAYDLFSAFAGSGGNTAFDVHLAGMGFAAAYYLSKWNLGILSPERWKRPSSGGWFKRGARLKLHDPNKRLQREEVEADRLLQKVSDHGQDSLTASERRLLERYSRRLRDRQ